MSKLPSKPNLEHLKNQAKKKQSLQKITLAQAQFSLAKDYGFLSWTRLKNFVEAKAIRLSRPSVLTKELLEFAILDGTALGSRFALMPLHEILSVRNYAFEAGVLRILVDGLLLGCTHAKPRVRFDCAMALDHMADRSCTSTLRKLMQDPIPRVRRAAIHAISCEACKISNLENHDDLILDLIHIALEDDNIKVRFAAIYALTKSCTDTRAQSVFEAALQLNLSSSLRKILTRAIQPIKAS